MCWLQIIIIVILEVENNNIYFPTNLKIQINKEIKLLAHGVQREQNSNEL